MFHTCVPSTDRLPINFCFITTSKYNCPFRYQEAEMALRMHDQPKLDDCFINTSVESFAHSLLSRVFVLVANIFYEKKKKKIERI